MKTIDISSAIKELLVFDDPEFCEKWLDEEKTKRERCQHYAWCCCNQFRTHDGQSTPLRFDYDVTKQAFKCQPCKTFYQKAKELQNQREIDLINFGEYFELIKEDGTTEIIDPTRITHIVKGCPKCKGPLNDIGGCENHECDYPHL